MSLRNPSIANWRCNGGAVANGAFSQSRSCPGRSVTAVKGVERSAKKGKRVESKAFRVDVECYAGYRADERPVRFRIQARGAEQRAVVEILDQWYGPHDRFFKALADDGNLYILRHDERNDFWTLDSFRKGSEPEEDSPGL
jgi:hypothetical protein